MGLPKSDQIARTAKKRADQGSEGVLEKDSLLTSPRGWAPKFARALIESYHVIKLLTTDQNPFPPP